MSTEEELLAKEEARLKRLGEKGKGNVFGGGLAAAQNKPAGRKLSGGASYAPPPKPTPAPVVKPVTTSYNQPARTSAPVYREVDYAPSRNVANSEIISESITPSKSVDLEEEAAREEERMMKSIGKFNRPESYGGGGGGGYTASRPVTTTTYQPPRNTQPPPSQALRANSASYPLEEAVVEEIALPPPSRAAYSAPTPVSYNAPASSSYSAPSARSANYVYPDFKVLQLEPTDNGTANILPISELACQLSELTIGLRKDGKAIEFKRNVQQNGQPRLEVQSFNLPYQVTGSTCSARYYPDEKSGLLKIKLGKVISGQIVKGEQQLLQFRVSGDPSSSEQKVMIAVDQQPDHYRFYPGRPSPFDTDFTVVLNGQSLEFRSTYSVEESDGAIKTINGKQTVQLPLAPTMDQVEVGYDTVTIWPTRQSGGPISVPDQDVHITIG